MINEQENVKSAVVENETLQSADNVSASAVNKSAPKDFLTVYKKKSTFKGATDEDFWFSATRNDGASVICKFRCPVETDSLAFEITDIVGTAKRKEVDVKGEKYVNYTYYITSCKFREIQGEVLPF